MRLRKQDVWGSGEFNAPRGHRKHNGVDVIYLPGFTVASQFAGVVTKIGYPYGQGTSDNERYKLKKALRYVEITDASVISYRYFYVLPSCKVGDRIRVNESIGIAQGLQKIYDGITEHYHLEIKNSAGQYLNPNDYIAFD